jgi:hypothetical protein
MYKFVYFLILLFSILLFWLCSKEKSAEPYGPDPAQPYYVGSERCGISSCHPTFYNQFIETGHAHILKTVTNNHAPAYPFDNLNKGGVAAAGAPEGNSWSDYLYVIGGFGWKALFIKENGIIETAGTAQYNLANQSWVAYQGNENQPYDYNCFQCHTSGADSAGEWRSGIQGTFSLAGVQCEACHGKGSQHASHPQQYTMSVNPSIDLCSRCHSRNPQNSIAVQNGFIKNYQQYNELLHSPHRSFRCIDCHNPHASAIFDDIATGNGVRECTSCHHASYQAGGANNRHLQTPSGHPTCIDCHMPLATKSAVSINVYKGDIHTHIFKINTDAVSKDSVLWTSNGNFIILDEYDKAAITLDFACYKCHQDENDIGDRNSHKTLVQLAEKAEDIHEGNDDGD